MKHTTLKLDYLTVKIHNAQRKRRTKTDTKMLLATPRLDVPRTNSLGGFDTDPRGTLGRRASAA